MQPEDLYQLDAEETSDLDGAALLVYMEGFMDAGAAGRLLTEHLLDAFEHTTVARFDTDRLLDYRSRRPLMTFDEGKWESYDAPELNVYRLADAAGKPFLLLTGPEPDHEWEAFAAATRSLVERLGAGPMITYFGVPMGIPHTRPLGMITHSSRPGLVASKVPLPSKLQVPGSASSLLEFRFGQAGDIGRPRVPHTHRLKSSVLLRISEIHRRREQQTVPKIGQPGRARRELVQRHQFLRARIIQRFQQYAIHDAEDRGVSADANRNGQQSNRREHGITAQHPQAVAHIG